MEDSEDRMNQQIILMEYTRSVSLYVYTTQQLPCLHLFSLFTHQSC